MSKTILLVEDDFDTRYILSLILRTEGYDVLTAADGEGALNVAADRRPDLIITDVCMPRVSGIEVIQRLKHRGDTASIPIIAITAYGPLTVKHAIDAGAALCASKPIVLSELIDSVKQLLNEPTVVPSSHE